MDGTGGLCGEDIWMVNDIGERKKRMANRLLLTLLLLLLLLLLT